MTLHGEPRVGQRAAPAVETGAGQDAIGQFVPQPPVSWFSPGELVRSGFHAFAASFLAGYIDRRETQAALANLPHAPHVEKYRIDPRFDLSLETKQGGLWIDFVADTGDGFNPTYSVASVVGQKVLPLATGSGLRGDLHRADLLVFGGDLVYPTPRADGYRNRLLGPFASAFPQPDQGRGADDPRFLFAVPGNHDWYDGLTHFLRTFCQGQRIGGWQTVQKRSYFAVQLPHRWWIWGLDIQLDTRIDQPQLRFFESLAVSTDAAEPALKAGDRVILCVPKPAWCTGEKEAADNLNYFIRRVITGNNATAPVILAGDLHHYARYTGANNNQRITAGGGGAYLRGTHDLPRVVDPPAAPGHESDPAGTLREVALFPDRAHSTALAFSVLKFPFRRHNRSFCQLLGATYMLGMASLRFDWYTTRGSGSPVHSEAPVLQFIKSLAHQMFVQPEFVVFVALFVLVCALYARVWNPQASRRLTLAWGAAHGASHILLMLVLSHVALIVARLTTTDHRLELVVLYLVLGITGAAIGGFAMGVYLFLSDRLFGWHVNEVFSSQMNPDFKCFLRMKLDEDGLTIYPIGIRRTTRRWRRSPSPHADDQRFEPSDDRPPLPHLIEPPIWIPTVS